MSKLDELMVKMKDFMITHELLSQRMGKVAIEAGKIDEEAKVIQKKITNLQVEILEEIAKDSPEVAKSMAKEFELPLKDAESKIEISKDEKINLA
jgi:hypothetical protein